MRIAKQISNARCQSASTLQTPKLPAILEQTHQCTQGIYVMRGVWGIVEKLRTAIKIPTGYQDEAGFHLDVEPAEKEIKSYRSGSSSQDDALPVSNKSIEGEKYYETQPTNHKIQQ